MQMSCVEEIRKEIEVFADYLLISPSMRTNDIQAKSTATHPGVTISIAFP